MESPAPSEAEAERTVDVASPVEFSITVPGDWQISGELSSSTTRTFEAGADRWVLFTQTGPTTTDEWLERLSSGDSLTASEPDIVEIGGASGIRLDITVPDGQEDVVLVREAFGEWSMSPGRPSRVWILEVGGEVLVILTDAPERAFDSWAATVEEALSTIVWAQ